MTAATICLKAGDVRPAELIEMLGELQIPDAAEARCWLEAADGWALDYWPGMSGDVRWNRAGFDPQAESMTTVVPRLAGGRVFAPSGELKWRVLPSLGEICCRTVFLGANWRSGRLELLENRSALDGLTRHTATHPLWGQLTAKTPVEWIDLRIPHRLRYPVSCATPPSGRIVVHVEVESWLDAIGQAQFVRLCGLAAQMED